MLLVQRFGTDRDGFKELLRTGRRFGDRTWAVERCNGIGRHVAQRLAAAGDSVLDVPPNLSARTRGFSTGNGRKTVDAHSIALAALRTHRLRVAEVDDATVAMRLLVDRRDELGVERSTTINQIRRLLIGLLGHPQLAAGRYDVLAFGQQPIRGRQLAHDLLRRMRLHRRHDDRGPCPHSRIQTLTRHWTYESGSAHDEGAGV